VSDDLVFANGINGLTGGYLLDPVPASALAQQFARAESREIDEQLSDVWASIKEPTYGLPFNVHPEVVAEAGWAIVFDVNEQADVKAALDPLVEHRRKGVGAGRMKVLDHRPGEGWRDWLDRHGTAPGNVDPDRVPYYLLLVGSPRRIPFSLQHLLGVEYAVGRVDFDDAGGYRAYASALIKHECDGGESRDAAATFFGTRHAFDGATQLSADLLVGPVAQCFRPDGQLGKAVPGYRIDEVLGDPATKSALGEIFAGTGACGRPQLVFSATHGMGGWPPGHPEQAARHGALLCQDWPGIGQINASQYFAAADLAADAEVAGMVAFFFACYGGGTPEADSFTHKPGQPPPTIASSPFVARLPKALLEAGALAVIGHVERAWGYSFASGSAGQLLPFQNAIGRILSRLPVGFAMKDFHEKYAALSANISSVLESVGFGKLVPDAELARLWTERNDAQNYIVLGDPAAALRAP
jgi:hypothetical protein